MDLHLLLIRSGQPGLGTLPSPSPAAVASPTPPAPRLPLPLPALPGPSPCVPCAPRPRPEPGTPGRGTPPLILMPRPPPTFKNHPDNSSLRYRGIELPLLGVKRKVEGGLWRPRTLHKTFSLTPVGKRAYSEIPNKVNPIPRRDGKPRVFKK